MEKTFIEFPKKNLQRSNKDIQYLVESVEILGGFNVQEKNIGLYKSSSILFESNSIQKLLLFKKSFKNFKLFLRSFNTCFLKYKYKRKFCSRVLIRYHYNTYIYGNLRSCSFVLLSHVRVGAKNFIRGGIPAYLRSVGRSTHASE